MTRAALSQIGAIITVAIVGVLIGRASISPAEPARTSTAPRPLPTSRGAVIAAIEYLDALRWDVVVDDTERRRAIRERSTPKATEELDRALAAPAAALREATAAPPVVARTAVLGYRLFRSHDRRASVRVWGVAVFGTAAYPPATQWSTSDVELVWSDGRWLIDGLENRGGPSPSFGIRGLARRTQGLEEVRCVP
jgi:hypothetical protein